MPKVSFSFSGWVVDADVATATDANGKEVDVSGMAAKELADKLTAGDLFISLGDYLYERNRKSEIEVFDFDGGSA